MPTFKHPCPQCGTFINRDVVACPACGRQDPFAPARCGNCRAPLEDPSWVACPKCGQPVGGGRRGGGTGAGNASWPAGRARGDPGVGPGRRRVAGSAAGRCGVAPGQSRADGRLAAGRPDVASAAGVAPGCPRADPDAPGDAGRPDSAIGGIGGRISRRGDLSGLRQPARPRGAVLPRLRDARHLVPHAATLGCEWWTSALIRHGLAGTAFSLCQAR